MLPVNSHFPTENTGDKNPVIFYMFIKLSIPSYFSCIPSYSTSNKQKSWFNLFPVLLQYFNPITDVLLYTAPDSYALETFWAFIKHSFSICILKFGLLIQPINQIYAKIHKDLVLVSAFLVKRLIYKTCRNHGTEN